VRNAYARRAGARFQLHGLLCAASFVGVGAVTAALGVWTSVGAPVLLTVVAVGVIASAAYAYYVLKRYRVRCPECEFDGAHFVRDTQSRLLLMCPQCGFRAATGGNALADSPVGH